MIKVNDITVVPRKKKKRDSYDPRTYRFFLPRFTFLVILPINFAKKKRKKKKKENSNVTN